jgi:histidinol phosphatase-like PHP family hydrolase
MKGAQERLLIFKLAAQRENNVCDKKLRICVTCRRWNRNYCISDDALRASQAGMLYVRKFYAITVVFDLRVFTNTSLNDRRLF